MPIEIKVPPLGESVAEATIARWIKKKGDKVDIDDPIVELETDKVTLEVPSPSAGIISNVFFSEGDSVEVENILAILDDLGIPTRVDEPKNLNNNLPQEEENKFTDSTNNTDFSPAVRRLIEEHKLNPILHPSRPKRWRYGSRSST